MTSSPARKRPSPAEIAAAHDRTIPDVLAPGLSILFVGINPSLYSAAVGHHFARPGNRFWPALHRAGFTPGELSPYEDATLLAVGLGLTNIVARATAGADELSAAELVAGGQRLLRKVQRYGPRVVAFVGVTAYRIAFDRPHAKMGEQADPLGASRRWVLPNPSGLNAHYSMADIVRCMSELRRAVA